MSDMRFDSLVSCIKKWSLHNNNTRFIEAGMLHVCTTTNMPTNNSLSEDQKSKIWASLPLGIRLLPQRYEGGHMKCKCHELCLTWDAIQWNERLINSYVARSSQEQAVINGETKGHSLLAHEILKILNTSNAKHDMALKTTTMQFRLYQ
jgi:hypothetical protein